MPLDPDIATAIERTVAAGWLPLTRGSVTESRDRYRELALIRRGDDYVPEAVADVSETTLPGPAGPLGARVYVPEDGIDAIVVFLHGGGWVIGDLDTHDPVCRSLANATRATVASIDYRLAPEAPYPAPLDDATAALRWAAERWPGHRLAVGGDSAGGALAAGAALKARDEGGPVLVAQLLVYPALDLSLGRPSVTANSEGYFLTRADMEWFIGHYLADGADRSDPYLDPLLAPDLSGLPPAVIGTGEFDPLCDAGRDYAARLADAGVPVTLIPGEGLTHGWLTMSELAPAAARAADELRTAFSALLS